MPLPGRGAPPGGPGPAARTAARRSVPLASTRRRRPGCAPGPGAAQLGREHGAARGAAAGELRPARGERPVGGAGPRGRWRRAAERSRSWGRGASGRLAVTAGVRLQKICDV